MIAFLLAQIAKLKAAVSNLVDSYGETDLLATTAASDFATYETPTGKKFGDDYKYICVDPVNSSGSTSNNIWTFPFEVFANHNTNSNLMNLYIDTTHYIRLKYIDSSHFAADVIKSGSSSQEDYTAKIYGVK